MQAIRIDEGEMVVRMLEAATGKKRPKNRTQEQLLATVNPAIRDQVIRTARAAILYFVEQAGSIEIEGDVLK